VADQIPQEDVVPLVVVDPALEEHQQIERAALGGRREAGPPRGEVDRVRGEQLDLEAGEAHQPEGRRQLVAQRVVANLDGERGELPQRVEIEHRRLDAVPAQQLGVGPPAGDQRRVGDPGADDGVQPRGRHARLTRPARRPVQTAVMTAYVRSSNCSPSTPEASHLPRHTLPRS
jgi:hypothetical protein